MIVCSKSCIEPGRNYGVPLKSGLKVIENTTFGYSTYDFLLLV